MENKLEKPYVNYEMIQSALEKFFERGGKIIETEKTIQDKLENNNFDQVELNTNDTDHETKLVDIVLKVEDQIHHEGNIKGLWKMNAFFRKSDPQFSCHICKDSEMPGTENECAVWGPGNMLRDCGSFDYTQR